MIQLKKEQKEFLDLSRKFLVPGYIQNKVKKGFIKTPDFHIVLDNIIKVLDETYPDLWDINFDWKVRSINGILGLKTDRMNIIIRFPEVTITNSKKLKTNLVNLFIRIPVDLNSNGLFFCTIQGTRSTMTNAEIESKYYHSHLSKLTKVCVFDNFCTGSGEINNITLLLNAKFDVDLFKLYLLHLNTFVSWESLEGTPYSHISSLLESSDLAQPITSNLKYYCDEIIDKFKKSTHLISNIQWKINKGKYEIVDNINFEKVLKIGETIIPYRTKDTVMCLKNNKGEYIKQRELKNKSFVSEDIYLIFRGEKIFYNLIDDFEPVNDPELYINPSIKNYLKKQLEYAANNKAVTASLYKR